MNFKFKENYSFKINRTCNYLYKIHNNLINKMRKLNNKMKSINSGYRLFIINRKFKNIKHLYHYKNNKII